MPFVIDKRLCVGCGSCIGNCPNRAIIRRFGTVTITSMCSDCGTCLRYCSLGAISPGSQPALRDSARLAAALREKLGLTRQVAGMRFVRTPPDDVAREPGPHFWCGMCGDVFDGAQEPLLFTAAASTCGGCANIGLGARRVTREDFEAALDGQVIGEGKLYATREEIARNRSAFPRFAQVFAGAVIGPLEKMPQVDLVLFPATPAQLCTVSTAYAFETGELIQGTAGKATCLMTVPAALQENRPVFCAGDHGGRTFMRLAESELLICFPAGLVPGLVSNLDRTIFASEAGA